MIYSKEYLVSNAYSKKGCKSYYKNKILIKLCIENRKCSTVDKEIIRILKKYFSKVYNRSTLVN